MSYGKNLQGKSIRHTPDSALKNPRALFQNMVSDLLSSRELAWQLFLRGISASYRQTFLGYFWAFLPPLALALGFSIAAKAKVINIGDTGLPYIAYIVISMTLWQTFSESLNGPIAALSKAKTLLSKVNFPREALILANLGEILFNMSLKFVLIAGILLWYEIPPSMELFYVPFGIAAIILVGITICLLLAPIAMLYKDISRGLPLVLFFGLFVTPIVFPLPKEGLFAQIVYWNPMTPLLVTTRDWLTGSEVKLLPEFFIVTMMTLGIFVVSWIFFRLAMPYVIERMGS